MQVSTMDELLWGQQSTLRTLSTAIGKVVMFLQ